MDPLQEKLEEIIDSFHKVLHLNNPKNLQPDFISHYKVSAYGSQISLKELASIGKIDSCTLEIKPFDPQLSKNIEQVLWQTKKGTVINQKSTLLFKLPPLTTEAIEDIIKLSKSILEEFKQKVKVARHGYLDEFKKTEKDKINITNETERIQVFVNNANQNLHNSFKTFQQNILGN